MSSSTASLRERVRQLAKVDLHRHLEGSLRLETVHDLARQTGLRIPEDAVSLQEIVRVQSGKRQNQHAILSQYEFLRPLFHSAEAIQRVTREAVLDAADDCVRYVELQFTPIALAQTTGSAIGDIFDWVLEAGHATAPEAGIRIGLIASINRHASVDLADDVCKHAIQRLGQGIVGLSLAGDENIFSSDPFVPVFSTAQQAGLGISIHAGEWGGAANIRFAIERLGAARIGHGLSVMQDPELVAMARDLGVVFEICLSSNRHSGVVKDLAAIPLLEMIQAGLHVTINTGDPGISNTQLSNEFLLALELFDLSLESLKGMILTAVQAAFLAKKDKRALEKAFVAALFATLQRTDDEVW